MADIFIYKIFSYLVSLKNITICLMGIVGLFLSSCKDEWTIPSTEAGRVQVNCVLEAGKKAFLYIYKPNTIDSATTSSNWQKDTLDAFQVTLWKDGTKVDSLKPTTARESPTIYENSAKHYVGLSHIVQEGSTYRIEIKKEGYPLMYADCSVPKMVKILSLDTTDVMIHDYGPGNFVGYHYYYYKVTFDDPSNETNYYLIEGYDDRQYWSPFAFIGDPVIENNKNDIYATAFFSDQLINGNTYTLMVKPAPRNVGGNNLPDSSVVFISLVSASKEYYLRVKSEYQYIKSTTDNYAEPVQLYNNMHNGLGIFAGIAVSTDTIRLH